MSTAQSASASTRASKRTGRVLLVDDHPVVRHGLRGLINSSGDMEVVADASSSTEAIQALETANPDRIVVALSLDEGSGIELIKQIKSRKPNCKMLVHSMHDERLFAERALRAGAMGYLNKQDSADSIVDALRQVMRGRVYLSSAMANLVLNRVVHGKEEPEDASPVARLSDRELEVFTLMGRGLTTRQIAKKLHLSPKTIETHREHIKDKLNISNNNQLVRHSVQWVLEQSQPGSKPMVIDDPGADED